MKKTCRAIMVVLLGLLTTKTARAEPSQILGEGVATCAAFINQPAMQSVRLEWVLGYLSGRNSEDHELKTRMTGRSINNAQGPLVWLQNFCTANPAAPLIYAGDKLRTALQVDER